MCRTWLYNPPEPTAQDPHQGSRNWEFNRRCGNCTAVPPVWKLTFPREIENPSYIFDRPDDPTNPRMITTTLLKRVNPIWQTWANVSAAGASGWCIWNDGMAFMSGWQLWFNSAADFIAPNFILSYYPGSQVGATHFVVRGQRPDSRDGNAFRCRGRNHFIRYDVFTNLFDFGDDLLIVEPYWEYRYPRIY